MCSQQGGNDRNNTQLTVAYIRILVYTTTVIKQKEKEKKEKKD